MPVSIVTNEDNMAMMSRYPDKYFDLAVVDPPYGLGKRLSEGGGKLKKTPMAQLYRDSSQWDVLPNIEYWNELFRCSKNQIIFGLYKFLIKKFAKPGNLILDNFLGSGSSRIAAYDLGFDFYGCELDKDYFDAQEKRFADHVSKIDFWQPEKEVTKVEPINLL